MTIEEKKLLTDILESIISVDDHLEHRRIYTEYTGNKTRRRAVERELEIIGEAVNKLLKINPKIQISTPAKLSTYVIKLFMLMITSTIW